MESMHRLFDGNTNSFEIVVEVLWEDTITLY